jgi:hypothetical protein
MQSQEITSVEKHGTRFPSIKQIDTWVANSLLCLDPELYRIERQEMGDTVVYTVIKQGTMLGKYRITSRYDADNPVKYGSIWCADDPALSKDWSFITFDLLAKDIERETQEFFRKPATIAGTTQIEKRQWHNGNTLYETPTSGSVIQLPDGKFIQAERMISPFDTQTAPVMQTQSPMTWRGNGEPPKTRAEKIRAVEAWDALPKDERPKLEEWLIENFGTDLATGYLNVPEATFHGWRNLKKS